MKNDLAESQVKRQVLSWLDFHQIPVIRNNTGKFTKPYKDKYNKTRVHWIHCGLEGSGDLVVCGNNGKHIEIELKSSTGKLSPEQKQRQKYLDSIGGLMLVIRSIDDLERWKHEIIPKPLAR